MDEKDLKALEKDEESYAMFGLILKFYRFQILATQHPAPLKSTIQGIPNKQWGALLYEGQAGDLSIVENTSGTTAST
jgi:hypothetical protein